MQVGLIWCSCAARRCRLGIALAATLVFASGLIRPQMAGAAAKGGDAMTNWASDVITETASASGRDPVEANRVTLTVAGGPLGVVQWSLSYTAHANTPFSGVGPRRVYCSHPNRCVARARWRRDRTLDARRSGRGPLAAGRATLGLGHRERPVRRSRVRLRAQDLRLEGVEQGFRRQRQHARPDLRGALIACRPPPLSGAGQGRAGGLSDRGRAGRRDEQLERSTCGQRFGSRICPSATARCSRSTI